MLVNDSSPDKPDDKYVMDYSFLSNLTPNTIQAGNKTVTASDKDATLLMDLWLNGDKKATDVYQINDTVKISSRDVIRLKTRGFLTGGTTDLHITNRGRAVITTMTLGESNNFLKNKKEKSYTEILANVSKKGKSGYRMPTFASTSHLLRLGTKVKKS